MSASVIQPLNNNSSLGAFNNINAPDTVITKIPALNSGVGGDQGPTSIMQSNKVSVIKRESIAFKVNGNNVGDNIN